MSRLGDLIRTERIRQKMTPKQVAKKCGVSESFILAVEAGTRIIADDQARRILKNIGLREQTEADFTLDDIAATVDLQTVQPALVKKPAAPKVEKVASTEETPAEGVAGSVWLDALSSVLKRVPVLNAVMKPVDHRLLPILNGRIEGANPEKVFYFLAPDDSMRGFPHSQRGRGPGGARTKPHRWRGHAGGIRRPPRLAQDQKAGQLPGAAPVL